MSAYKSIVITGASSGIGRALARCFAEPGVSLVLAGRDEGRLQSVADDCQASGATVRTAYFDVTDDGAVNLLFDALAREAAVPDLVIANAGVIEVLTPEAVVENEGRAREVIDTNLTGLVTTVEAAVRVMAPMHVGRIALMSSTSAITPLPHAPVYSATKAGIRAYGEALRPRLADRGIGLTIIVPGHVKSPMDDSYASPKPFQVDADSAARTIRRGLEAERPYVSFPFLLLFGARLTARAPRWLRDFVMRRMRGVPVGP